MVTMDFATLVVAFEVALMISMVVNATKEDRVSRIGSFLLGGAAAWAILSLAFAYVASAIQESFGRSVVIAFAMLIVHVALIALIARKRA